jgi:hypothetical protein
MACKLYANSCNSCSRLTGARELRKLSCKLSLLNSHQLSCNSCSRLTRAWELRKLSCKLSLLNSHQLSCDFCFRLTGAWELRKLSCKLSLLNSHATLMQTLASQLSSTLMQLIQLVWTRTLLLFSFDLLATLVLVWPGHESWENSHTHSRFSTLMQLLFSFDQDMRAEKTVMQTLASQLSCKLSLLELNSHATLVLVWPGHESWENSNTNSRFSTRINSHATLVLVWPGHESWENSNTNSHFSTLIIV